MKLVGKIVVSMKPVDEILARKGLDRTGDVQAFFTSCVNRRITKYIPYRTGMLSTKLKRISSTAEIMVLGPYAQYQYYGKAMEGPAPKRLTNRDLRYARAFHPNAGPFWDRALLAAEKDALQREVQSYVNRKKGTK